MSDNYDSVVRIDTTSSPVQITGTVTAELTSQIVVESGDLIVNLPEVMAVSSTFASPVWVTGTVPSGTTAYITSWNMGAGSSTDHATQVTLCATCDTSGNPLPGINYIHDTMILTNNTVQIVKQTPMKFPEKTDIQIQAISDASNANVTVGGSWDGWYETND